MKRNKRKKEGNNIPEIKDKIEEEELKRINNILIII